MPELLAAFDAFMQEHRRSGDIDGGVDDQWDRGARITRPLEPLVPRTCPST